MSDDFLELLVLVAIIYAVELVSYLAPPRQVLLQGLGRRFLLSGSDWVMRVKRSLRAN